MRDPAETKPLVRAGDLRMVDPGPFHVGKNLAITPGVVVFRNRLLEVIQYKPRRDQVHEVPVVLVAIAVWSVSLWVAGPQRSRPIEPARS